MLEEIKKRQENYIAEYLPLFENNGQMQEWNDMFRDNQCLLQELEKLQNNGPMTETTKQICELGDLTHDYSIQLAQMVDARNNEIKRLQQKNERYKGALENIIQKRENIRPDGEAWEYIGEFNDSMMIAEKELNEK